MNDFGQKTKLSPTQQTLMTFLASPFRYHYIAHPHQGEKEQSW